MPLGNSDAEMRGRARRDAREYRLPARLKPGVSRKQAQAEMDALARQLASAYPKEDKGRAAVVTRATLLPPDAIRDTEIAIGIRLALGARPRQLIQMVLRRMLMIAGAGVGAGILFGVGATVLLRSQFCGIIAVEWRVLAPVGAGMLGVALLVAYLSAKAWITIEPMEAVQHA